MDEGFAVSAGGQLWLAPERTHRVPLVSFEADLRDRSVLVRLIPRQVCFRGAEETFPGMRVMRRILFSPVLQLYFRKMPVDRMDQPNFSLNGSLPPDALVLVCPFQSARRLYGESGGLLLHHQNPLAVLVHFDALLLGLLHEGLAREPVFGRLRKHDMRRFVVFRGPPIPEGQPLMVQVSKVRSLATLPQLL